MSQKVFELECLGYGSGDDDCQDELIIWVAADDVGQVQEAIKEIRPLIQKVVATDIADDAAGVDCFLPEDDEKLRDLICKRLRAKDICMGNANTVTVDWNVLRDAGLLARINKEILHPMGLAVFYDPVIGVSGGAIVSASGTFVHSPPNPVPV